MGAAIRCPACFAWTVPQIPHGGRYPSTGYDTSFGDFRQLLETEGWTQPVAALLATWFGYRVVKDAEGVWILNAAGEAMDPLWVHLRIQGDAERQGTLYRTRMDLWR
jgi:hypothetical protein